MSKRDKARAHAAHERELAPERAKRAAVYAALWNDRLYCRMHRLMERWNHQVTLGEARLTSAADLEKARRNFKRAHTHLLRLEAAALLAAGCNPCL